MAKVTMAPTGGKTMIPCASPSMSAMTLSGSGPTDVPRSPAPEMSPEDWQTPRRVLYAGSPLSGSVPPKKNKDLITLIPVKQEPQLSAQNIYQARKLELETLLTKQRKQNLSDEACVGFVLIMCCGMCAAFCFLRVP